MRWTLRTFHKPAFQPVDTVPFVDSLASRTFDRAVKNWTARGFLSPRRGVIGKKKPVSLYSAADLLKVFTASGLIRQHTSLYAAFAAGDRLVERVDGFIRGDAIPTTPAEEAWLVFSDNYESSADDHVDGHRVNFHLLSTITYKTRDGRDILLPEVLYTPDLASIDFEEKLEYFNADRTIRKFLRCFYESGSHEALAGSKAAEARSAGNAFDRFANAIAAQAAIAK